MTKKVTIIYNCNYIHSCYFYSGCLVGTRT